jgi:hypothetical protein
MNQQLKSELLAMAEEDSRVRAELVASGELFQGYAPRMAEVHRRNAEALDAIIQRHGWPGKSLVGEEGADAAWLVLQHAIGNPALQRKCLPLLSESVASGEMKAAHVAYLEDRICVFEQRPQRYGTQFDWDENGQLSPWPLEDPERVDAYRKSVGLGTLSEKIQQMRKAAESEGETPPVDFRKRQEEREAWARSVGWL